MLRWTVLARGEWSLTALDGTRYLLTPVGTERYGIVTHGRNGLTFIHWYAPLDQAKAAVVMRLTPAEQLLVREPEEAP